jgi:short-subunit dehydrogenase
LASTDSLLYCGFVEKFLLLGASRGLGWATYKILAERSKNSDTEDHFLLVARTIAKNLPQLKPNASTLSYDFSKPEIDPDFLAQIKTFQPTQIIYFAGGGPFGLFQSKSWSSHMWSLRTTFLFPAELLHKSLSNPAEWNSLKQVTVIGSSIAEEKPDPMASSYCAAKHGLKGLLSTIKAEQEPFFKLDLFSPGYIQTDLLPAKSKPRLSGLAEPVDEVALRLVESMKL